MANIMRNDDPNMSWFPSNLASVAKNYLKEAQKTIDKALEIDETAATKTPAIITPRSGPKEETDNFFASFGLNAKPEDTNSDAADVDASVPASKALESEQKPTKGSSSVNSSSLWGSFSGSFFDSSSVNSEEIHNVQDEAAVASVCTQPKVGGTLWDVKEEAVQSLDKTDWKWEDDSSHRRSGVESLCDDSFENENDGFSRSILVVEPSSETDCSSVAEPSLGESVPSKNDTQIQSLSEAAEDGRLGNANEDITPSETAMVPEESENGGIEDVGTAEKVDEDRIVNVNSDCLIESDLPSCERVRDSEVVSTNTLESLSVEVYDKELAIPYSGESSAGSPGSIEVLTSPGSSECLGGFSQPNSVRMSPVCERTVEEVLTPTGCEISEVNLEDAKPKRLLEEPQSTVPSSSTSAEPEVTEHRIDTTDAPEEEVSEISFTESLHSSASAESSHTILAAENKVDLLSDSVTDSDATVTSGHSDIPGSSCLDEKEVAEEGISKSSSNSSFVKTLLEDAMGEEEKKDKDSTREVSPSCSDRSELVKMESEQNSGQTSGDEVDLTTSSDIEIISSPNSENGAAYRVSPSKMKWGCRIVHIGDRSESDSPISDRGVHTATFGSECSDNKQMMQLEPEMLEQMEMIGEIPEDPVLDSGHRRKPSDLSSDSSTDIHSTEVETLLKKISDMTEILEAREAKVLELSKSNMEIMETNNSLRSEMSKKESEYHETMQRIQRDQEQNMQKMNKKMHDTLQDRERLRSQLQQVSSEATSRPSAYDVQAIMQEKEELIQELREEGENLSKQQLKQSNIIKKLRVKEKETDAIVKSSKEKIETQTKEIDKLKKSVAEKEEAVKQQKDAVKQLNSTVTAYEKEMGLVRGDAMDNQEKVASLRTSLEAAYKELAELRMTAAAQESVAIEQALNQETAAKKDAQMQLEKYKEDVRRQQDELVQQIQNHRFTLSRQERDSQRREDELKEEIRELQLRLSKSEARVEELMGSVAGATRPLLRQLETLQTTYASQQANWEKVERGLSDRLMEMQRQTASLSERERSLREQCLGAQTQLSSTEAQIEVLRKDKASSVSELEALKVKLALQEETNLRNSSILAATKQSLSEEVNALSKAKQVLQHQLDIEKTANEAEKRRSTLLQENLRCAEQRIAALQSNNTTPQHSPTPSLSKLSFSGSVMSESFTSNPWPTTQRQHSDDVLETASRVSYQLPSATGLENLQSQLKQKEGEIQQLQHELGSFHRLKESMAQELVKLSSQNEELLLQMSEIDDLKQQFQDTQSRYDAMLLMYGEKLEENEELRLDLDDVKQMYKTQINELLKS